MENLAHNRRDYRDLAIETLSDENDQLTTRVAALLVERDAFRELALRAIAALHDVTVERDRLTERIRALVDDLYALRARAA